MEINFPNPKKTQNCGNAQTLSHFWDLSQPSGKGFSKESLWLIPQKHIQVFPCSQRSLRIPKPGAIPQSRKFPPPMDHEVPHSHTPLFMQIPPFRGIPGSGVFFPKGWERSWKKSRRKSRNPHSHLAAKGSACADLSVDPELWDHKISRKSGAGISQNFRSRNPPGIPGAEISQEFQEHSPEIPLRIPSKKSGTVFSPPVPRLILQEQIHGIHTRNDSKTSKTLPAPGKKKLENPLFHPVIPSRITGKRRE